MDGPIHAPVGVQYALPPMPTSAVQVRLALALIVPIVARIVLVPADAQLKA
jgi:hypothetical protein